jgi:pyridoxine 5-phosphate synthase
MTRLGINVDHVATLRQARREPFPDPTDAALAAIRGGADGITAHLREDRRHIQDADIRSLKEKISVPLNLEMAATPELVRIAQRVKPDCNG